MKTINLKQKGNRFEWAVVNYFKGLGYLVTRSAGSHGLADVIVITDTEIYLIQLKVTSRKNISTMFNKEIEEIRILLTPDNCKKEFWYKRNKDKIYRVKIGENKGCDLVEELPCTLPFNFNVIKRII